MFQCDFGRDGQPTGDPWIDAGIVGFFDYIEEKSDLSASHGVKVDFDSFALSADEPSKVEEFLRHTFEKVKRDRYIVKTGRKSLILNQKKHKLELTDKINRVPVIAGLFVGGNQRPEYDKVPFPEDLRPQLEEMLRMYKGNKLVDTKTVKEGKIFASPPSIPWKIHPVLAPRKKRGKGRGAKQCAFCGREYPAAFLHSNNNPFIVATKNWSNFSSQQSLELKMCSLCEVASLFAFNRIFFSLARKNKDETIFIAIPHAESLNEIDTFWADIRWFIGEKTLKDPSNVLEDAFRYTRLHETVLAFAHRLYSGFSEAREGARSREEARAKIWHFYLAKKTGNVLSFGGYVLFDEMERLFQLFDEIAQVRDEHGKPLIDFAQMFTNLSIKEGDNWNNFYREAIATAVLRNRPVTGVAESFVYAKDTTVRGFTEFVKLYHTFRLGGMENEQ